MTELLALSDPRRPLDLGLLERPGAFVWWYVDLVDEAGDGFVIIWSFGLPFLPGYLSACRRGEAVRAGARPSVNVVLYRGGASQFYLLQEYGPGDASWRVDGGVETWRFGRSSIESRVTGDVRRVALHLDMDVPRSADPLRAAVTLEGRIPALAADGASSEVHTWCPLVGPARCAARFDAGPGTAVAFDGLAYHDRNGGASPLDDLGIDVWTWGRTVDEERIVAYYVLWPEASGPFGVNGSSRSAALREASGAPIAWLLSIDAGGRVEVDRGAEALVAAFRRAPFGMRHAGVTVAPREPGRAQVEARTVRLIDVGPFYLRALSRIGGPGEGRLGFSEWVRPSRVDLARHRPLVRMRVDHTREKGSLWLPLFSGPAEGRVRRLLTGPRGGRV